MIRKLCFSLAVMLVALTSASLMAQSLPDVQSTQELPSTTPIAPRYERLQPFSTHGQPDFLNSAVKPALATNQQAAVGFSLANVVSVPNFQGSFSSRGKTWPFTMLGSSPAGGASTSVPAHIIAVSLKLQNADLVTFTTIPVASFQTPTLNSPNFKPFTYSSGANIQYADAVQRAEFFHAMKSTWHTALSPVA